MRTKVASSKIISILWVLRKFFMWKLNLIYLKALKSTYKQFSSFETSIKVLRKCFCEFNLSKSLKNLINNDNWTHISSLRNSKIYIKLIYVLRNFFIWKINFSKRFKNSVNNDNRTHISSFRISKLILNWSISKILFYVDCNCN